MAKEIQGMDSQAGGNRIDSQARVRKIAKAITAEWFRNGMSGEPELMDAIAQAIAEAERDADARLTQALEWKIQDLHERSQFLMEFNIKAVLAKFKKEGKL